MHSRDSLHVLEGISLASNKSGVRRGCFKKKMVQRLQMGCAIFEA